jgi:hypothetical protein
MRKSQKRRARLGASAEVDVQPNWRTVAQAVQLMRWRSRMGPATRSQSERTSEGVDGEISARSGGNWGLNAKEPAERVMMRD